MRRTMVGWLVALATVLAACGGDDDGASSEGNDEARSEESGEGDEASEPSSGEETGDRQAYVEAIQAASEDDNLTDEENLCVAELFVEVIGLERLSVVTPEEIRADPNASPADLGIELTSEDGETLYAGLNECYDVREIFLASIAADDPALATCLDEGISDEALEAYLVAIFTMGSDAQSSPAGEELGEAYQACIAEGGG